jgi:guanylate kinase
MLLDRHPGTFVTSISHTTRDPRPGEVRGQDYYYVSMQEFEDLIAKGGFLEHAKFGSNRYGTSKSMIEEMGQKGKVVILDIEMEVRSRKLHCASQRVAEGLDYGAKANWKSRVSSK